ncbi:Uncharacterised protein [uncultured archaeon]|nr:Uncharacterised protein [uncultured archaeon]
MYSLAPLIKAYPRALFLHFLNKLLHFICEIRIRLNFFGQDFFESILPGLGFRFLLSTRQSLLCVGIALELIYYSLAQIADKSSYFFSSGL